MDRGQQIERHIELGAIHDLTGLLREAIRTFGAVATLKLCSKLTETLREYKELNEPISNNN
jgi:hypothetical protein